MNSNSILKNGDKQYLDDEKIVELYWKREEKAISETDRKYRHYLYTVAFNILHNELDCEECLNDTWMKTWTSIPPQRPVILSAYLGTITRNLSLNRLRTATAQKRNAGSLERSYEELQESIPDGCSAEAQVNLRELGRSIDCFLRSLPQRDCCVFLRRYWYMDTNLQIARRYHMTEGSVKANLHRTRKKLKAYLAQEGHDV